MQGRSFNPLVVPVSAHTSKSSAGIHGGGVFEETLWSRVFAAARNDTTTSRKALEDLCQLYWQPIYAFLRRWGHDFHNARDLTQGFFAYLLEGNVIAKAAPERGRFRSFLLGVLKNFVSNEKDLANAQKRGATYKIVSIDEQTAEGFYANEPVNEITPEKLFDRRWSLAVLEQTMDRLRGEYERAGMAGTFELMQPWLTGDQDAGFAELGLKLGKTEGAARVLVFRLRNRFRQILRAIIADTVAEVGQVEVELQHLQAALRP